jgi:S1-C subfamily serine protease
VLLVAALSLTRCATPGAGSAAPAEVAFDRELVGHSRASSRRDLVQRILPHNVRIFVDEGGEAKRSASGVVIGSEATTGGSFSYVVTNAHVIHVPHLKDPSLRVVVEHGPDSVEYAAEPVLIGKVPELDLALVRVRGVRLPPAAMAGDDELSLGEDVIVAAAPFGKAISISGGMLSQVEWDKKGKRPLALKTDAAIGYGASGGGMYSGDTGKLLAIVEGYRTAKVGFQVGDKPVSFDVPMPGETFAVPVSRLREFLAANGYGRLVPGLRSTAQAASAL